MDKTDVVENWLNHQNEKLEAIIKKCKAFSQQRLYYQREQDILYMLIQERKKELKRRAG